MRGGDRLPGRAGASEAIEAAGAIGERPPQRRRAGRHLRRSAQRRLARRAARPRARATPAATCHVETLLAAVPEQCGLVTVIDGHPATLGWLGGVRGHRTISLGVEHFGQTGTVNDLYRHFGIDAGGHRGGRAKLLRRAPVSGRPFLPRQAGRTFGPSCACQRRQTLSDICHRASQWGNELPVQQGRKTHERAA